MALVVFQLMKAAARQSTEKDLAIRDKVLNELKCLTQTYLMDKMTRPAGDDTVI